MLPLQEGVATLALASPVVACFEELAGVLRLQSMVGQGLQPSTVVGNLVMQGLHVLARRRQHGLSWLGWER